MSRPSKNFSRIGFVVKRHQPRAVSLARELTAFAVASGRKVLIAKDSECDLKHPQASKERLIAACDLIVVLGGDGTFLSIARLMRKRTVPIFGVNMGTLGFLTETNHAQAFTHFRALLEGEKFTLQSRKLLEVTLRRGRKVRFRGPIVNDAVISKGTIARIIGLEIERDGKLMNSMRSDGLIIATPTGSTAYSLAAGGPIVEPTLGAIVLAPICPHSLTQRPIVVSDEKEMTVRLAPGAEEVMLTLDGQDVFPLTGADEILIRKFDRHAIQMLTPPGRDFFGLLREKLSFGTKENTGH